MKESALWRNLSPELQRFGKFQKISDRFTPGVPDVIGSCKSPGGPLGVPVALELKEFSGMRVLKVKFRPRQLDWLREWEEAGGKSFILSSHGNRVLMAHHHSHGPELEQGVSAERAFDLATLYYDSPGSRRWKDFTSLLVDHLLSPHGGII